MQNEKLHTLFKQSDNPDLQEQRYMHLVNIMNELKRQVEQPNQPRMHQASMSTANSSTTSSITTTSEV